MQKIKKQWFYYEKFKKEQIKILNDLSNNKIDLVIGTHRLLSDDVPVENLGLLIVDEEHKFGVKHKNKIQHNVNYEVNCEVNTF